MSAIEQHQKVKTNHRQQTRLYILLPTALAILLIVICVGFIMSRLFLTTLADSSRVSLVADWMLTIFMLCPAAICTLPLALLAVAGVIGMSRAHVAISKPLQKLEDYSRVAVSRTAEITDSINEKTIATSARFGPIHKILGVFERPDNDKGEM
jgi:hypothetical protein